MDNDAWPGSYPTMGRIQLDGDDEVGIYIDAASGGALGNNNTAIWLSGGVAGDGDYGLFFSGFKHPIFQQGSLGGTGYNYIQGELRMDDPHFSVSPPTRSTAMGGLATIPSGVDTVWVDCNILTMGRTKANTIVHVTPHGRIPDGDGFCAGHIGFQVGSDYGFTIYCSTTQAADQEFGWSIEYYE